MKKDTHPQWYPDAEVVYDGEVIMTIGSTQPRIVVDVWSGTHPFFTGETRLLDTEGQVDRFMRRLQIQKELATERETKEIKKDPRNLEVAVMDLGTRVNNALIEADLTTVGDVLAKLNEGEDELLAIDGVGQTALINIRRYLRGERLIE